MKPGKSRERRPLAANERFRTRLQRWPACPFCGKRWLRMGSRWGPEATDEFFITCMNCDAAGPALPTADAAIRAWGVRP